MFLLAGPLTASVGEFVTNFIAGVEGKEPVGNFLFAMGFYGAVLMLLAYPFQRRWLNPARFGSVLGYVAVFGLGCCLGRNRFNL